MTPEPSRQKSFLFVDDDASILTLLNQVFSKKSQGSWEILAARNHSEALAQLSRKVVDVVVLDVSMPVMDGVEFLRLLRRTHPSQQVVMLTGNPSEEIRKTCLDLGASLYLKKPLEPEGFETIFSALDALAQAAPHAGFRGMMRQVGLQEVLQMECLGRKSSVLEVFTSAARGRIYIAEGNIVHAESGTLQGEVALYGLLALRGGEFNLLPFVEPAARTISGQYEFLLMEAARLKDEAPPPQSGLTEVPRTSANEQVLVAPADPASEAPPQRPAKTEEVILLSGAGEVLFEQGCKSLEPRVRLLSQVEQQASQLGELMPMGRFEGLEVETTDGRIVCKVQTDMRVFVRSSLQAAAAI
jgi:CheY-like chemotaxis protein